MNIKPCIFYSGSKTMDYWNNYIKQPYKKKFPSVHIWLLLFVLKEKKYEFYIVYNFTLKIHVHQLKVKYLCWQKLEFRSRVGMCMGWSQQWWFTGSVTLPNILFSQSNTLKHDLNCTLKCLNTQAGRYWPKLDGKPH